jgi:hypothetical protein
MNHTKCRDKNEPAIVQALLDIGACVTRLDDAGVPDLLVGYKGRTFLLEVKFPHRANGKSVKRDCIGGRGELTSAQVKWWDTWTGTPASVVHTEAEALAAIGATP